MKLTAARHIVNPHLVVQNDVCTAYIMFTVPDETANQWVTRTRTLVAEIIAGDQADDPPPQRHTSITLSDAQQERTP